MLSKGESMGITTFKAPGFGTLLRHGRVGVYVLAIGLMAAVFAGISTKPAYASQSDCYGSGWLCAWQDINYSGNMIQIYNPSYGCHNLPSVWWDKISSASNWTTHNVRFYSGTDCFSVFITYTFPPNYTVQSFAGYAQNDQFRSYYVWDS